MRIAICDDDINQLNTIENYINKLTGIYPKLECDVFSSGSELIKQYHLEKYPYDMIFLDMEMDDINGIDTAKRIRMSDERVLIIYVTSHKEYVYDCFEVNPFRFLVKPVAFESFESVFKVAHEKVLKKNKPFYITNSGATIRLYCDEILYFESNKRKVTVYSKDNEYEFYAKLQDIYEELQDYDFIPTHKSYLVNLHYIKQFNYLSAVLNNGCVIPISENKRKEVRAEHLKFLARSYKHE